MPLACHVNATRCTLSRHTYHPVSYTDCFSQVIDMYRLVDLARPREHFLRSHVFGASSDAGDTNRVLNHFFGLFIYNRRSHISIRIMIVDTGRTMPRYPHANRSTVLKVSFSSFWGSYAVTWGRRMLMLSVLLHLACLLSPL